MVEEESPLKDHWHPCSLQRLTPRELVPVVNAILQGQLHLLSFEPEEAADIPPIPLDKRGKRAAAVKRHLESSNTAA